MRGTKALAATWDFIGLDEMKRANVTLRDGSIYPTYMGYVPYIPDVQVAWAKLMNALFGSLFFATIGAGAFAWRSEEHTSELQSLMRISYAVFCLKKKKHKYKK